jgi:UDP-MurNAc hydroxylase
MKFTILSHAGMLVEAQGIKLVSDPWILGSSYWRSWWNYPKPASFSKEGIDYIYLTHMHWDHFHGPSLRKFPPSVTFLVPKAPTTCIVDDLKDFHYKAVIEMAHGKTMTLAPGLRVTSYQFGLNTDSTLVIEDGQTTLVNMNDCKLAGGALKQVLRRHPHPDFLLRSHSSAQPYPHCIDAEDENDLRYRKNEDYVADFVEAAKLVEPRFAIPFASNNCFLHRDSIQFNHAVVSPLQVKTFFDQHKPEKTECVVMVAGDSWDDREGFRIHQQDFFTAREQHLEAYAKEVAPVLEEYYRKEDAVRLTFQTFEAYFKPFLNSLPWFSKLAFRPVVAFELEKNPGTLWVIDFEKKRVFEAKDGFSGYALRFRVPPAVLRDCLQRKMFTLLFPSKRLRVEIKKGRVKDYFIFEQLFDLYEYRLLPIRSSLNVRSLSTWLRRWRELHYMLLLFVRVLLLSRRDAAISELVPRTTV